MRPKTSHLKPAELERSWFVADAEGNATVDFATNEWCIGCDDESKNIVGKAVIVHQGVDDFTSQPSGAAGARVACTGIIQ